MERRGGSLIHGDLQSLVYNVLASVRLSVPVPISSRRGPPLGGGGGGGAGWEDDDRFRAGVRAVASTMFIGAVTTSAAKKLTALVTTLVANTIIAASARRRELDDAGDNEDRTKEVDDEDNGKGEDAAAFAARVAATLAREPPLVTAPGSPVESSLLAEGVLLSEGIHSSAAGRTMSRSSRGGGGGVRVVVLYGTKLNDPLPPEARGAGGHGGERLSAAASVEVNCAAGYHASLAWSRTAAHDRAATLASRGVSLLLCTEHIDETACEALASQGIAAVQLVPEEEALRVCLALGDVAPVTDALPSVLAMCDVGVVEGYSEQNVSGQKMLYLRVPGVYTALVRGAGDAACRTYAQLVRRGLKAAAAAMVPGQEPRAEAAGKPRMPSPATMSLVPGAGACEAGLCAAVAAELETNRRRCRHNRRRGNSSDGEDNGDEDGAVDDADFDGRAMALEVVLAMARAVPAALARATASTAEENSSRGGSRPTSLAGGSFSDYHGDVVETWRDDDRYGRRDGGGVGHHAPAARPGRLPRAALELLALNSDFTSTAARGERQESATSAVSVSATRPPPPPPPSHPYSSPPPLLGLVSPAFCPEAFHPGTAAAVLDRTPPTEDEIISATAAARYPVFVRPMDPSTGAVLEPLASKYATVLAAVEIVGSVIRLGDMLPSRLNLAEYAAGRVGREGSQREIGGLGDGDTSSSSSDDDRDSGCSD